LEEKMPGHIVVVGSINMDLVVRAPRHPEPGETILGSSFQTFPGGKGANQAVAAARLGGAVRMIGRVGTDSFGDSLLATLQKDRIDTSFVRRSADTASGVALITVNEQGQNTIVVVPGANGKLSPQDIRDSREAFVGASVVLLQLEIPIETVKTAAEIAREEGAGVILNPAPAQQLSSNLLSKVDFLIPNESELGLLTGMQAVSIAADSLRSIGTRRLVVTLGSQGVLVIDEDGHHKLDAHTVPVVDTTAAGDAFVGAFAVALTEHRSTREAAVWGNAAGALAVTAAGAQPSLPDRPQLEDFLASHSPKKH
jgi:ribokinase